ncbi:histidine phosphatase family protein [Lysinibacillus sp. 54212]|uniref:histidine phosphatase family protein n=1 Tax=Lysinibacillus sp. 54212 TaxID=3119829 RepID=UPI002FC66E2D
MTRICLVRHGETDWNVLGKLQGRTDVELNSNGVEQAKDCGRFLAATTWNLIITSPLQRAKKTAEIIQTYIDVPLIEMQNFVERSYGDGEGMSPEERLLAFPDNQYSNAEDRASLTNRVMAGITKINDEYEGGNVILVAHGAVINSILASISNGSIGSGKTQLHNACISELEFDKGQWHIKNFNKVDHFTTVA